MARGKQTCKILRDIRRQIAEANDIEFVTSECRYKGDCPGTCPKCEAEVRYLEQQLRARTLAGKAVRLVGISASVFLMSGCGGTASTQPSETLQGEPEETPTEQIEVVDTLLKDDMEEEEGEVYNVEDTVSNKPKEHLVTDLLIVGGIEEEEMKNAPQEEFYIDGPNEQITIEEKTPADTVDTAESPRPIL